MNDLSTEVLDEILALQILVAWAGEGRCEPARLGWWSTDLVDEFGGGDFFSRLLPNTHKWAALEAVREVARRHDNQTRRQSANPDQICSLYHFGYEIDRQLAERMAALKAQGGEPGEAIAALAMIDDEFDAAGFADWLAERANADTRTTPGGRRLKGAAPASTQERARSLAAALVPFDDTYPQPHYQL
jgi:hypothetical protein